MTYETYCKYRDIKGLTNNQVAKELKLDSQNISAWKLGKCTLTFKKQKLIAEFLNVPLKEFAEISDAI